MIHDAEVVLAFHRRKSDHEPDDRTYDIKVLKDRSGTIPTDESGFLIDPNGGRRVGKREGETWPWYWGPK